MGPTMSTSRRPSNRLRGGWGGRAVAAAMLAGGVAAAAVGAAVDGAGAPGGAPGAADPRASTTTSAAAADPFTAAQPGQCISWRTDPAGGVTAFAVVDCAEPHRYEVSRRVDLAELPEVAGEYPPGAGQPTARQLVDLRDRVCREATVDYLDGRFDPAGAFTIAPMLPPAEAWAEGDRTMLCGIQRPGPDGSPEVNEGPAKLADQAATHPPGACVAVDERGSLVPADCAEPHIFESVAVVDLRAEFGEAFPAEQAQNDYLSDVCTAAAVDYFGGGEAGDDALYASTLLPFWLPVGEESWSRGSHSTNCWLAKDSGGEGFATLQGPVLGEFTIDGAPPTPPPPRNPRRGEAPR